MEKNMKLNEKPLYKKTLIALILINLLTFLVYHVTTYLIGGRVSAYVFFYFREIAEFTLPPLTALAIYAAYLDRGRSAALIRAIPYALTSAVFKFPYHAFEYAYEGIEIDGVMLFSALNAILGVIVYYVETVVLYLLISIVTDKISLKNEVKKDVILSAAKPFDLDAPLNAGILSAVGAMFVYKLVLEIIDTVNYIVSYAGSYRIEEIIYMTFRYVFILALAILAQLVIALIKNRVLTPKESEKNK
jgi:hypothetical protein